MEALKPVAVKRYEVRDAKVQGLHVRVSTSGSKIFYVFVRQDSKRCRLKIGPYPMVSLAEARRKAMEIARDAELGALQPQEVIKKQICPTLGEIIPEFIRLYAQPNTKDWKGTQSILTKFNPIAKKRLDEIKRTDIVRILDDIVASGTPTRANRALAAIKKLMNWCVDRGVIEISSVAHLRPPTKEKSRDRVLSHAEMGTLWHSAIAEGYPFKQFVQVLMLTGQRRGEVAGMRWSEVDLEEGIWTLPANRVKNGRLHVVPLSTQAIDILKSIPRFLNSDLVFTTTGKTSISGFGRLKERLALSLPDGTEDWRFHDFRRTVSTEMARLGIQPHVIDAVTNHKSGVVSGVAATYNRYTYLDEKREALQIWSDFVEKLTTPKAHPVSNTSTGAEAVAYQ